MAAEEAAVGALPLAAANPRDADAFKGVRFKATARSPAVFEARSSFGCNSATTVLGRFCTAEEAARAYDDAVRKAGRRAVNFPRAGTDEVQAVKGEAEEVTLKRHADKLLPPRNGPPPRDPEYKGVGIAAHARTAAVFTACIGHGCGKLLLGSFCTAEEAARAYDDAARKAARRVVNFPRPCTDEVQAVRGEEERVTLLRHDDKLLPPRSGPLPPAPDYKGVSVHAAAHTAAVFRVSFREKGVQELLGSFCTAEEAARAYDDAVRNAGRRVVNFPRLGTGEVQAVKGETDPVTLARHTAAQQAAGGAGAAGAMAPPSMATPPAKRRAAASPPSEPPRKRVPSRAVKSPAAVKPEAPVAPPPAPYTRRLPHRIERESSLPPGFVAPGGIRTETPAAVKPEAPVAPPHVPYTASTGRPLQAAFAAAQAALAALLPPDHGPGLDAPASTIKTESPAAVKPETPAAPPMPAAAAPGWPSPAPPVKMEH